MIFADSLPRAKRFLACLTLSDSTLALLTRLLLVCLCHTGRASASQAASAIRTDARHRANLTRFLARTGWAKDWSVLDQVARLLLKQAAHSEGTWLFVLDQTYVSTTSAQAENTFRRANRTKRSPKSNRKQKKHAPRKSHCFVLGLLLSPCGLRIPCCKSYYTKPYCQSQTLPFRTQTELGADLIDALAVPEGAPVVVLGDTAFEAASVRHACARRGFDWVMPANPERVLAGPKKQRPKLSTVVATLSPESLVRIELRPGLGAYAAQQRASLSRLGRKAKGRASWVHAERLDVHNVGSVQVVFSTMQQPQTGQAVTVQKVLLTNRIEWTAREVVALYACRWQVELFFKELKSTLGLDEYRCRRFVQAENWVQACLVMFCYLEWYRAEELARADLSAARQAWWRRQRSHGIGLVVRAEIEQADLKQILHLCTEEGGREELRQRLAKALPLEYRQPA